MPRGSIARSRDFQRVFSTGRRARRDGIVVWAAPATDPAASSRLGLAVRRSAGNAVTRNRIRRRLRAAFAQSHPVPGYDVVARGELEVAGRNFQEVRKDLAAALRAAGVETGS